MKKLLLISLFFVSYLLNAQINQPSLGWVFDDSSVSRIDISIDQDSLDELLLEENWYNDHEYPANMLFTRNGEVDTVLNVGFRLRGNTSRQAYKKSFKIAINSFTPGEKYKGLKKINLNSEHNDPSISRSKLNWDILRNNGMPSTRVAHSEFYINEEYKGLYINVEHINDDFLKKRYGNDDGNLYKCLWPANLHYISSDPEDYKLEENGRRVYELKTNNDIDDYSDLANFIDILNNTDTDDLYCELSKVFDVEDFLEILAIDVMTGNWDGYSFNKNNYYLYNNSETGRFQYIPYDLDNTLGIDWFGVDWTERSIYNWSPSWDYLPLYDLVMQNEELKEIYTFFINQMITQLGENEPDDYVDDLKDMIAPYAELDTFRILDYGFSYDDFLNSFSQDIEYEHVDAGIKPFYEDRSESASTQVQTQDVAPIIRYLQVEPALSNLPISIKAFIEDEENTVEAWAHYTFESEIDSLELFDDGEHGDGEAFDGWYANAFSGFDETGSLSIQIKAKDVLEQERLNPCLPLTINIEAGSALVINEFMAKNDSTIQDNMGNYSDWVEIYNNSDQSIFLGDYYLSDDIDEITKWQFPDVSIDPEGFYLVWCSAEPSFGENHSNFKLSASGEDVVLSASNETDTIIIDALSYNQQFADTSFGRQTDAHPNWVFFPYPTPNSSNGVIPNDIVDLSILKDEIKIYPNPFISTTRIENDSDERVDFWIYLTDGRLIKEFSISAKSEFSYSDSFESGLRIVKWRSLNEQSGMMRIIKVE